MMEFTTYEWLKLLYVSLTGGFFLAGSVVVWFLIKVERVRATEDIK